MGVNKRLIQYEVKFILNITHYSFLFTTHLYSITLVLGQSIRMY